MKAYSFYFNTSDWLASPAVKMMSKAERGVYIGLLASAWESPVQGTLPASVDKVRRLAEMSLDEWAESGETLLEKFPLSECGTYRYNPRLLTESIKEQARSDKAKASADKRWQSERNANASEKHANASKKPCKRNAQVKLSKESTDVDVKATATKLESEKLALQAELISLKAQLTQPAPEALPAKTPKELAVLLAGDNDLYTAATVPMLNDARLFDIVLTRYGVGECDQAHYMREIRATCESKQMSAGVAQFESFIKTYLKNDAASKNGLVKPVASSQPKGRAANEIQFELNPTAVARRRREAEEMERTIVAANLERINRNEGTNFTVAGVLGHPSPA